MTGSNRRPSACKADALPAELILHILHLRVMAWRRPTLLVIHIDSNSLLESNTLTEKVRSILPI